MSPKILRRCTLCGKFHASYLVNDLPVTDGKGYLCYACWTVRYGATEKREKETPPAPRTKAAPAQTHD